MDQNKEKAYNALQKLIKIDKQHESNYVTIFNIVTEEKQKLSVYEACNVFLDAIKLRHKYEKTIDVNVISLIDEVVDYLEAMITILELSEEKLTWIPVTTPKSTISYISTNNIGVHPIFNANYSTFNKG